MNKDKKGLLAYIIITIVVILMPPTMIYLFLIAAYYEVPISDQLFNMLIYFMAILFLLYLIAPVVVTHRAITKNWSKYLDKFFNNIVVSTLILITLLLLMRVSDRLIMLNKDGAYFLFMTHVSAVCSYSLIYVTILLHKIVNLIKKLIKR